MTIKSKHTKKRRHRILSFMMALPAQPPPRYQHLPRLHHLLPSLTRFIIVGITYKRVKKYTIRHSLHPRPAKESRYEHSSKYSLSHFPVRGPSRTKPLQKRMKKNRMKKKRMKEMMRKKRNKNANNKQQEHYYSDHSRICQLISTIIITSHRLTTITVSP